MSKLSRTKGAAFERHVASRFRELGIEALRNLEEVRSGNSGDIVFPGKGLPLAIQAKCGARPPIYEAMEEAIACAKPGQHPIAITRRNGSPRNAPVDLVTLPLDDFLEIVDALVKSGWWR